MSPINPAQQKPSAPDGKPSERTKEGIRIPLWWGLVALIMAALVYGPIQYALTYGQKPVAQQEPQAEPKTAATEATQPKPEPEKAEPAKSASEAPVQAEAAKPAPVEAAHPKEEPTQAEPSKLAAVETPQPKEEPARAESAKPAAVEAVQPKEEPQKAEPAKSAAAEVEPPKQEPAQSEPVKQAAVAPVEEPAKPAAAVTAQAQPESAQAAKPQEAAPSNQKVALTKPAEKLKVDDAIFYRIEGQDQQGRVASFDFITLTNEYKWALGSSSRVVSSGKLIPESQTADRLFPPKVREALSGVSDVVAVGLASQEGKRSEEEARAAARSKTAAAWLKKVAKPEAGVWTLTLGQYDEKACKSKEDSESSFDRPVLFVSIRSKADGVNLQEALAEAIGGHSNLPSRDCYSRFDLAKVR